MLGGWGAYWGSYAGPFIFDDPPSIAKNPTIRQLWPIANVLSPPSGGQTVAGRPSLNFSLAVNYAVGGESVRGYHALNVAIHILAGLALFGIVRRTLRGIRSGGLPLDPAGRPGWSAEAAAKADGLPSGPGLGPQTPTLIAFVIALLWVVHPLQTESVTYIIQRGNRSWACSIC